MTEQVLFLHKIKIKALSVFQKNYAILFTARFKREIFLAEVFLWNTPLRVALSIVEVAESRAAFAASLSFASIAAYTFLTAVLTPDLIALFLSIFVRFTRILFFADLIFAKVYTSHAEFSLFFRDVFIKAGHGRSNANIRLYYRGNDLFCQYIFLMFW